VLESSTRIIAHVLTRKSRIRHQAKRRKEEKTSFLPKMKREKK
jgi:hypothetical protein